MSEPRMDSIAAGDEGMRKLIERLVFVSVRGLPHMFRSDEHTFSYTRFRRGSGAVELSGRSLRYGAIVLLGACYLPEEAQRPIFGGESADEFCGRLISQLDDVQNLGDVALVTWAAAQLVHPQLKLALKRLRNLTEASSNPFVVEQAWVVSALSTALRSIDSEQEARKAGDLLVSAFPAHAGSFPHLTRPGGAPWYRAHVGCFADQVYPIQALSRLHAALGNAQALEVANRCAQQICRVQGDAGQWWWHYDSRTGKVIEGYPVYSVHQDSMAPMALLDLIDAGGDDYSENIRRGLLWMESAREVGHSLIDDDLELIWRKVARREPSKLSRGLRAVLSRLHPDRRLGFLDTLLPPTTVDWESRPYHLGWVLHTWLTGPGVGSAV